MNASTILMAAVLGAMCASGAAAAPQAQTAASAFADRVIETAQASDVFENVTSDAVPRVRHKASGMPCFFLGSHPESSVTVFPGSARGADVACGSFPSGLVLTMYAVKPPKPLTLREALAMYIAEVRTAHPDAKPPEEKALPALSGTRAEGLTDWLIARFQFSTPTGPVYSRLAVAIVDGWVVEQRLTTNPGQDWIAADRIGEGAMVGTLQEMIPGAQKVPLVASPPT